MSKRLQKKWIPQEITRNREKLGGQMITILAPFSTNTGSLTENLDLENLEKNIVSYGIQLKKQFPSNLVILVEHYRAT